MEKIWFHSVKCSQNTYHIKIEIQRHKFGYYVTDRFLFEELQMDTRDFINARMNYNFNLYPTHYIANDAWRNGSIIVFPSKKMSRKFIKDRLAAYSVLYTLANSNN